MSSREMPVTLPPALTPFVLLGSRVWGQQNVAAFMVCSVRPGSQASGLPALTLGSLAPGAPLAPPEAPVTLGRGPPEGCDLPVARATRPRRSGRWPPLGFGTILATQEPLLDAGLR